MHDKHGRGRTSKVVYSFLVGLVCFLIGIIPFLKYLGFSFFPNIHPLVIEVVLFIAGLILFYDSFSVGYGISKLISITIAILLALLGAIPLLIRFSLLSFLPFFATVTVDISLLQIVLLCYGIYLIFDAYVMRQHYY